MKRTPAFKANDSANEFIEAMGRVVMEGEKNTFIDVGSDYPIVIVLGAPRSGTTVLLQWLNQIGISSPSNISARFYRTPYFAGLLQRLLTDKGLNYRDELTFPHSGTFDSDYGKTKGLLSPHEFSFFIRDYFPVTVGEKLSEQQRQDVDAAGFVEALSKFATAMRTPVSIKGLLFQYDIDMLAEFNNVFFIHTYRNEADNVCSLMRQRSMVAGDIDEWISVRPPQYDRLKSLSAIEQVAGQVHFTNVEVNRQLESISPGKWASFKHEDFCANPLALFKEIEGKFKGRGFSSLPEYRGPSLFPRHRYDKNSVEYRNAAAAIDNLHA